MKLDVTDSPTDHGGLSLREQTPIRQSLSMQLLATGHSAAGYATVIGLENILDHVEGWGVRWDVNADATRSRIGCAYSVSRRLCWGRDGG